MSGSIKVGGNTIATHTGAQGAGEVTLGTNLRLPASGGIQDSSGNNVLTESGGTITLTADETNVGSNALVVNSSGNVGVGTSSPTVSGIEISRATGYASPTPAELRLSTTTNASDWSTTDPWGRISFYSADTSDSGPKIQGAISAVADASNGGGMDMTFSVADIVTYNLTEAMRIDSSGNLLVGRETSDGYRLAVAGNTQLNASMQFTYSGVAAASVGVKSNGSLSFGLDLADGLTERMFINSSGLVYQEGNTNQSVKTKSIMARWGSMIMSKIVSTGSCNGSGASITWESININGDNRQIFASSSTGTPSGYRVITDAEGRFPIIIVDCGGSMQLELASSIPSFWTRIYVRDDISFAPSFS